MRRNFINFILIVFFTFVTNCGYTPLLNSDKINFNIVDLNFEGDRKINNYIENSLRNQTSTKNEVKKFNLNIASTYKKTITNKDESGDPKNYNLQIKANVVVTSSDGQKSNNNFEKNISLSAQDKKIDERELEKKYIKDLSELIGKDIIFFLINQ